ncbi:MAG: serine--tRNA ligase [Phycisphaerales bacterium]|nr:serine--tRNA ligase [Planctomycetota bacterium]
MIDLRLLRENPGNYKAGAKAKNIPVDIDRILALDEDKRRLLTRIEHLRAEQNKIAKESGPLIGKLSGSLKQATGDEATRIQRELEELKARPAKLKAEISELEPQVAALEPQLQSLLLQVPLPPDADVPVGAGSESNVEIKRWSPPGFQLSKSFEENRGFKPKTHQELVRDLKLADFERGVKLAGTRSYVLTGMGMRLHMALLRYATDFMTDRHGFTPISVPVLVREEAMIGTGFFPAGREQAYHIAETQRRNPDAADDKGVGSHDLYLTGTGEVGLMGLHMNEILDEAQLPLRYVTVSTCFRREAGAAGKDTAGLYRIHQFDKVEQVVICKADEAESRAWHKKMIGFVEEILQSLEIPYRLLQCCTGDLGPKNADMVDIESWMPGRGQPDKDGRPQGDFGETHSASRLYDFQCRRLNMRYRAGAAGGKHETVFCHSLNNTVLASPRFLIPLLENHQQQDGSVRIPAALRPYLNGAEVVRSSVS